MRNARSKSSFRPRWRQRIAGGTGKRNSVLKSVTSLTSDSPYDPEVSAWVKRVNSAGGSVSNDDLEAASTFIRTIKTSPNLRGKIKRLNLFSGNDLTSSLVPLISDVGPVQDINNNFDSSEYSSKSGIKNSTASGNKYLDTGIDFTDAGGDFFSGHLAVNTLGANTSSSYKECIGRDHAAMGFNKESGKFQFRWGKHTIYADNPNPQQGACMGFYLGNVLPDDATMMSLRINDREMASKMLVDWESPSNADLSQHFHIFKRNTDYTPPSDFDQTINFYSIGLGLDSNEAKVLYDAVTVFNQKKSREIFDAQDIEVWRWANHRIPEAVGDASTHFSSSMVQNADAWMKIIKEKDLRGKISRANLFLGKSSSDYAYLTALVPLIIDKGNRIDTNYNFIHSDYTLKNGLRGDGATKSLDTGVRVSDLVNVVKADGFLSVETSSPSTTDPSAISSNCLIGARNELSNGGVGMSISLSKTKLTTRTHTLTTKISAPSTVGTFTVSLNSFLNYRTYYNDTLLKSYSKGEDFVSLDEGASGASAIQSTINIFALNNADYSNSIGHSKQLIKNYSMGSSLSTEDVQNLYAANQGIRRKELTASDPEVYSWANSRVPENGGVVTQKETDAANAWMLKVKSSSGLREKLKRVNLMAGSNLSAKMVPLIIDSGYSRVDKNTNLSETDSVSTGLKAGDGKSIDTTVKISDFITASSGHISVKNYADLSTLITGDTFAHGVISSGVKSNLGFSINSEGVKGYVWDNANSADYLKANQTTLETKKTVLTSDYRAPNPSSSLVNTEQGLLYWGPAWDEIHPTYGRSWLKLWDPSQQADVSYAVEEDGDFLVHIGSPSSGHNQGGGVGAMAGMAAKINFYKNDTLLFSRTFGTLPDSSGPQNLASGGEDFIIPDLAVGDKIKVLPDEQVCFNGVRCSDGADCPGCIGGLFPIFNAEIQFKRIVPSTQNALDGLWTTSRSATNDLSLYLDGTEVASSTASPSSDDIVATDDYVNIMGSYSLDGTIQNHHDNASRIGFYSLGLSLTAAESLTLSEAVTAFDDVIRRDLNEECWDWAYKRIPENGGIISEEDVGYVDTFMKALKLETGLRESIKRLNIFAGTSTNSAMVPLIKDFGDDIEKNYNFTSLDVEAGMTSDGQKHIDTGISLSDIPSVSFANFHTAISAKGTLPSTSNGYALGNGGMKINLTDASKKLEYATSSITSSHAGVGLMLGTAVNSSETKLYKGGSSSDAGPYDGNGSITASNFIIFGDSTEQGPVGGFAGRISLYSIGVGLSSGQVAAFNAAIATLEGSLKRGDYSASNSDVWKWANVSVPANNGTVTQRQVDSVNKFMESVSSVPNLRESIKRMNLFVGENLNAALVPVVADLGSAADANTGLSSSHYTKTGGCAGLTGGVGTYLDTGLKASDLTSNNSHMSFRSKSGSEATSSQNAPIMGAEKDLSVRTIGTVLGKTSFFTATSRWQAGNTTQYLRYISDFRDLPRKYDGCSFPSVLGAIKDPSISESNCGIMDNGQLIHSQVNKINESHVQKATNNRVYFETASKGLNGSNENPLYTQVHNPKYLKTNWVSPANSVKSFSIDHERDYGGAYAPLAGQGITAEQAKGFYSVITSKDFASSGMSYSKIRMYKNGEEVLSSSLNDMTDPPSDTIAIFGTKNDDQVFTHPSPITLDFYCLGTGPEEASTEATGLRDVLDNNFSPREINAFLNELDQDLDREDYSVASCSTHSSTGITATTLDGEVSDWANKRVAKAGGVLNDVIVDAVNDWMTTIKAVPGLREKLTRVNLFSSLNLRGALVPIICDGGYAVDLNKGNALQNVRVGGFTEGDFSLGGGLNPNLLYYPGGSAMVANKDEFKWLDTGLDGQDAWGGSKNEGHVGFATAQNWNMKTYAGVDGSLINTPISCCKAYPHLSQEATIFSTNPHGLFFSVYHGADRTWLSSTLIGFETEHGWKEISDLYQNGTTMFMSAGDGYGVNSDRIWTFVNGTMFSGFDTPASRLGWGMPSRGESHFTIFAKTPQRDASNESQGGLLIPSRSSSAPIPLPLHSGDDYVFALTDEEFYLENLVNPSSGNQDKIFENYVNNVFGLRWTTVTDEDIALLWAQPNRFNKLLKDLNHGHRYDKPIGWLDVENSTGKGSNASIGASRLLLQNNKQSTATAGLNTYNSFSSDATSSTLIRTVKDTDSDVACKDCGFSKVKAPILIKARISKTEEPASTSNEPWHPHQKTDIPLIEQNWYESITYYSIGRTLSAANVTTLNDAYKVFAAKIGRETSNFGEG